MPTFRHGDTPSPRPINYELPNNQASSGLRADDAFNRGFYTTSDQQFGGHPGSYPGDTRLHDHQSGYISGYQLTDRTYPNSYPGASSSHDYSQRIPFNPPQSVYRGDYQSNFNPHFNTGGGFHPPAEVPRWSGTPGWDRTPVFGGTTVWEGGFQPQVAGPSGWRGDHRPDQHLRQGYEQPRGVIENFKIEKGIHRLSSQEIAGKNLQFEKRYAYTVERRKDGAYEVNIRSKRGGENFYTNSVDFRKGEIMGEYNYKSYDRNGPKGYPRMPLSDIKYQSLRIAIDAYNHGHPLQPQPMNVSNFRPRILSGGDVEESSLMRLKDNFPPGSELTFVKGTPMYNDIMLTTVGKEKLFYAGNYTSGDIAYVKVARGTRSKYIGSIEFHLG